MADQLKASIVRIVGTNDLIVGAGFLVSERHVLTCAHVVAAALEIPDDTEVMPAAQIRLNFPLIASQDFSSAHVVLWRPVRSGVHPPPRSRVLPGIS